MNENLKIFLQILIASIIVALVIILSVQYLLPRADAQVIIKLPATFVTDAKISFDYLTYRSDVITKVTNRIIKYSEVKDYIRMLNIEHKLKPLKGKTIYEINNEILTRILQ